MNKKRRGEKKDVSVGFEQRYVGAQINSVTIAPNVILYIRYEAQNMRTAKILISIIHNIST